MKRNYLFPLLILTLLISALPVGQVSAVEDYSENYWTLEEALNAREAAKQEVLDFCQFIEESDCMEWYRNEYFYDRGSNYSAADNVNNLRFLITAINPVKNTLRMLFVNDDMEASYHAGELVQDDIDELYIAWFDPGQYGHDFYNEYQANTISPHTHLVFAAEQLAGSFPPSEEVTFEVNSIRENSSNSFNYFFITTTANKYSSPISYNNCITHPTYREGMECRLFFSKLNGGDLVYLPVKTASNDITTEPEIVTEAAPLATTESDSEEPITTDILPLTPETGANSRELSCTKQIELPWWLFLLIAIGEIITIYCLSPNIKKYHQNHQKS